MPKNGKSLEPFFATGIYLLQARTRSGLNQVELARRTKQSGLTQGTISQIENGKRLPTLPQLVDLARSLGVSMNWFLQGSNRPGKSIAELTSELRELGIVDLAQSDKVAGAFHLPEQVVALCLAGDNPDPRIVDAMPSVLAWNAWTVETLLAFCRDTDSRAPVRLAWLADATLMLAGTRGFPGGCQSAKQLELIVKSVQKPAVSDDLGRPGTMRKAPLLPHARWCINYAASVEDFHSRACRLNDMRKPSLGRGLNP